MKLNSTSIHYTQESVFLFTLVITENPVTLVCNPGEVHKMLRVQAFAAHIGGHLSTKFSKQGSFFGRFPFNMSGLCQNSLKIVTMDSFPPKMNHKSGYKGKFW